MDLNQPYLTQQIIAYIGNKRRLLSLIEQGIEKSLSGKSPGSIKFLDLFSGSGIVARLGKYMGFEVYANDWEYYSYILNRGYLGTNPSDLDLLFGGEKAFEELLRKINTLPAPAPKNHYISRYYSPGDRDIDKADFRTERLFYTRENGLKIDGIRQFIEEEYGGKDQSASKDLLTALLLYEAATHTNTSGVFKAFHKGFGGHGRDAMKRITAPIELHRPPLWERQAPVHIFNEDANDLIRNRNLGTMDIVYLDPPYNQHQYGSNYHMLNTIALWDKIPAPLDLNEKGVLKEKAAIRKDWINTRSDYCYRDSAVSSFRDLLDNLDARNILISYSTDGIIPFEIMKDLCARRGEISLVTNEYTTYRGGKQSNSRKVSNIEFVLMIRGDKKSSRQSIRRVDEVINRKKLLLLFKQNYSFAKLSRYGTFKRGDGFAFKLGKREILIPGPDGFRLNPPEELSSLTMEESDVLNSLLNRCLCHTKEEELEELLSLMESRPEERVFYLKKVPDTFKKLAHKKNKKAYYHWLKEIEARERLYPEDYGIIKDKIKRIKVLAQKRFEN
ncbi:MAG: DNA adenine methylase [Spirochaetales bacterium]|nr:DNA adenine methylase [Spirochaetales bacterium]